MKEAIWQLQVWSAVTAQVSSVVERDLQIQVIDKGQLEHG